MSVMATQQFSDMHQQHQHYGVQTNTWTMAAAASTVARTSPFAQPSAAPLLRQRSSETNFFGALSPDDSTNNSSLQSSPAGSPAALSPEMSEISAPGGAGPLNKVNLPRVMSAGEARNHRRKQATRREARRAVSIRKAFKSLEECIPGHDERSCTRLETLEHATNYIVELAAALKQSSGRVALLKAAKAAHLQQAARTQYAAPSGNGLHAPLRMDTPPAEPASQHPLMALDPTASVFPTVWPQSRGRLSHEPRPTTMPVAAHSAAYQAAPVYRCTAPTSLATNGALAPDLNMLDIQDMFCSPDGVLSDESTSWTEYLDSNIAEAVH